MWERMDEGTIFVDDFHDAASKDGDWLIIGKYFWIKYFHLICHLILTKINCITLKIRSKADFKSKSQNIWQQIILFSSTVMQNIHFWTSRSLIWKQYNYPNQFQPFFYVENLCLKNSEVHCICQLQLKLLHRNHCVYKWQQAP
jgi:hypothetical protein